MEDVVLFEQYRGAKDGAEREECRNRIVEKYYPFALKIARKFDRHGVDLDDLNQVAALALIKGVERFDPSVGVKFSTYIAPTIMGEIKNYFRDRARPIRLSRKANETRVAIHAAEDELTVELGRKPSVREVAARAGISEEDAVRFAEAGSVVSFDQPVYRGEEESAVSLYDLIAASDDGAVEQIENRDLLDRAMAHLSEAENRVLALRFGESLSQAETARRMGSSQMQVSRLERKALGKLREIITKKAAE